MRRRIIIISPRFNSRDIERYRRAHERKQKRDARRFTTKERDRRDIDDAVFDCHRQSFIACFIF